MRLPRCSKAQAAFLDAFKAGELDRDVNAVVRFQGPRANGMPELHRLTPSLTALQNKGFRVALITDGRMSGASGAVPAAIHVTPGADQDSPLARIRDGDRIVLDAEAGVLDLMVEPAELAKRGSAISRRRAEPGWGRELFAPFREMAGDPERGGGIFAIHGSGTVMTVDELMAVQPVIPVLTVERSRGRSSAGGGAGRRRSSRPRSDAAHRGGARLR